jgi:hypothetical protein
MDHDADEEKDPNGPEDRAEGLQEMGVPVYPVGILEDLEVPHEVSGDKQDKDNPGHGHEKLPADRAAEESADKIHRSGVAEGRVLAKPTAE